MTRPCFPLLVKGAGIREYWEDTVILLIWGGTGSHAPSMRHPNETLSLPLRVCGVYMCVVGCDSSCPEDLGPRDFSHRRRDQWRRD